MNSEDEVIQILRDAIARHDPQSLLQLSDQFSTGDSVLRLRGNLHGFIISPYDYDLIFQWMRHQDATLAKIVSAVVLFTQVDLLCRKPPLPGLYSKLGGDLQ